MKYIAVLLSISVLVLLLLIFMPRTYQVPATYLRQGTQFWQLATGSKIGYLHIAAKGTKKPYPIIFLQGGPGGYIANYNIETLTPLANDGYDVYLYDQIGSGQSARLSDITAYSANRHKQDLEAVFKTIGSEKVILIGQSWGAVLATLFLADNPNNVEKIIFTGAPSIQPSRDALLSLIAPDSLKLKKPPYFNEKANKETANIRINAVSFFAKTFGIKLATDKELDDFQTYRNQALNKATVCDTLKALNAEAGGGFYAQVMTVNSFRETKDPRAKLSNCKIPALILKGQCDTQPWGYVNEYLALFPNHTFKIIPDAGHVIAVEQPTLYLNTIKEFLNN